MLNNTRHPERSEGSLYSFNSPQILPAIHFKTQQTNTFSTKSTTNTVILTETRPPNTVISTEARSAERRDLLLPMFAERTSIAQSATGLEAGFSPLSRTSNKRALALAPTNTTIYSNQECRSGTGEAVPYQSTLRVKYIAAATPTKLVIAPTSNAYASTRNNT